MKKLISLLLFLSITAFAADVRWTFTDFTSSPHSVKKIYITPIAAYGTNSTNIITGDRRTYTNNSLGSLIVSNVIVGRSYRVELHGPFTETVITNSFDSGVSGFVEAVNYIAAPLSDGGLTSYSKTAADARFHNVSGDTSTNAAFRGTFKIPAGATVGYVLTVTNADGSSAWSPGSGSSSTSGALTNNDTRGITFLNGLTVQNNLEVSSISSGAGNLSLSPEASGNVVISVGQLVGNGGGLTNLTGAGSSIAAGTNIVTVTNGSLVTVHGTANVTQAGLAAGSYAISFSLSNVTSYAQRVGLDFANSNKVWQWANHRRLYSNAYTNLVDCCFLRSNLNASSVSTIQTFSRTNTVSLTDSSSMVYDSNGLYLPGSATQRAYWLSVPDCQTNTLIYQARTWNKAGVSHNGNDFFHYWNGTYGSSPYSAQMLALNNGNVYFQTYSSVGSFGSSGVVFDISASGIQPDGWLRTYVYSQDGSGQYISVDGLWAASGNTTNRLGATATGFTAGFTNIQIGFQNGTYNVPCLSQVWMLFDKVLTGAEEIEERAALRFLDDSSENHVIIGDSRAAHAYNGTNSWSGELENYAKYKGRWYDIAKAGEYTTNINFNGVYLTNAAKWRPRGGATKTTAWMLTGVNDSGASVAAATTWGAYSNIAFKLREAGMEVKAVIPCLGNAYSTLETQLAWYIRTNSFMFNEVIEMGKIVSDYDFSQGGTYYSPDTLHFSTNTAKLLSHWIGTGYKRTWPRRVSIPSQVPTVTTGTYFLTNTYGWRHRAIIYGGTVTGVSLGTNTVSIGTVVPTIEIDPWCWIAVTNSVVPSIFFQTVD